MKLCCDITVYWASSIFDHVEGVLNFYRQAIEIIGSEVTFFETGDMAGALPFTPEMFNLLPKWLSRPDQMQDTYMLTLETHKLPNMPSDKALDIWAVEYPEDKAGALRLVLPYSFLDQSPVQFIDLTRKLVEKIDFHSGHAGFAINWDYKGEYASESRKQMAGFARRFLGIDLPDIACTLCALNSGIKSVNWLTLLGNEMISKIGGKQTLRASLSEEIGIVTLEHGVIVRAGEKPGLGDVNRQDFLPAYREVGKALAKIRAHGHPAFIKNVRGIIDEEITEAWLARFEGSYL